MQCISRLFFFFCINPIKMGVKDSNRHGEDLFIRFTDVSVPSQSVIYSANTHYAPATCRDLCDAMGHNSDQDGWFSCPVKLMCLIYCLSSNRQHGPSRLPKHSLPVLGRKAGPRSQTASKRHFLCHSQSKSLSSTPDGAHLMSNM